MKQTTASATIKTTMAAMVTKIDEVAGTLRFIGKTIIIAVVAFVIAGGFHIP